MQLEFVTKSFWFASDSTGGLQGRLVFFCFGIGSLNLTWYCEVVDGFCLSRNLFWKFTNFFFIAAGCSQAVAFSENCLEVGVGTPWCVDMRLFDFWYRWICCFCDTVEDKISFVLRVRYFLKFLFGGVFRFQSCNCHECMGFWVFLRQVYVVVFLMRFFTRATFDLGVRRVPTRSRWSLLKSNKEQTRTLVKYWRVKSSHRIKSMHFRVVPSFETHTIFRSSLCWYNFFINLIVPYKFFNFVTVFICCFASWNNAGGTEGTIFGEECACCINIATDNKFLILLPEGCGGEFL